MNTPAIDEMRGVVALQRKWRAEEAAKKGEDMVATFRKAVLAMHEESLLDALHAEFRFEYLPILTLSYRGIQSEWTDVPSRDDLADWMDDVDDRLGTCWKRLCYRLGKLLKRDK